MAIKPERKFIMSFKQVRKYGPKLAALGGALAIGSANAVFTVPTEVTDAATSVALVGAAVFAIMVGIKLYKWIARAL
jgi:hypothetical protein